MFARYEYPDWPRLVALQPELQPPVADIDEAGMQFTRVAYDTGIVSTFDWSKWQEQARRLADDAALQRATLPTLRKLITLHVRKDRFVEGHLRDMIQTGQIAAILRAIEARLSATKRG